MIKKLFSILILPIMLLLNENVEVFAGDLHGTITWQYNKFIGTRGDNGAKIWLCPETDRGVRSVYPTLEEEKDWIFKISDCPEKGLFFAEADGYGKFEIYGIPEGKYQM